LIGEKELVLEIYFPTLLRCDHPSISDTWSTALRNNCISARSATSERSPAGPAGDDGSTLAPDDRTRFSM
jgi:hypothetical protein